MLRKKEKNISGVRVASRSAAFLNNVFSSLSLQLVNIVVGLIVPRMIIATYGSETNGLISSLTQFVTYIQLVEAGISSAAVFQLYRPLANNDINEVNGIIAAAKHFYYKSGGLFTALVLALAAVYSIVISVEGISSEELFVLTLALGATGFLDFFVLAKYRVLLTATQRNWVIQLGTVLYKILYAIVVVTFAGSGFSVTTVYVVAIAPIIIRSTFLVVYVRYRYPGISFKEKPGEIKLTQHWDALYLQVLGAVQTGAPIIIATFVLQDLSLVSIFSVYMIIVNGLQGALNSFCQGTQASFGDVIARNQSETLKKTFREFQVLVYGVVGIVCGVAFVLIEPFIHLYTSDVADINYVYPLIGFLAICNVLLYHLKTPQGLLVIAAGLYHDTRAQTALQAVILLVASTGFGLCWGVPGILAGMCCSNLYRTVDLMFFIPKRVTHTSPFETLRFMVLAIVICIFIVTPYYAVGFTCSSWSEWTIAALLLILWGVCCKWSRVFTFCTESVTWPFGEIKNGKWTS